MCQGKVVKICVRKLTTLSKIASPESQSISMQMHCSFQVFSWVHHLLFHQVRLWFAHKSYFSALKNLWMHHVAWCSSLRNSLSMRLHTAKSIVKRPLQLLSSLEKVSGYMRCTSDHMPKQQRRATWRTYREAQPWAKQSEHKQHLYEGLKYMSWNQTAQKVQVDYFTMNIL